MRPQAGSPWMAVVRRETGHAQVLVGQRFSAAGQALGSFITILERYGSTPTCLRQKTASSKTKACTGVFPCLRATPGNRVVTDGHRARVQPPLTNQSSCSSALYLISLPMMRGIDPPLPVVRSAGGEAVCSALGRERYEISLLERGRVTSMCSPHTRCIPSGTGSMSCLDTVSRVVGLIPGEV